MGITGMAGAKISQSIADIAQKHSASERELPATRPTVNFCYQAIALKTPFAGSMSVIAIYHQLR